MKQVLDLKFLVEEMILMSELYLPGDFDSFYFEIKEKLSQGSVDKKDVMKAIKNCKGVDLNDCSFKTSFYYFIKAIDQNRFQINI